MAEISVEPAGPGIVRDIASLIAIWKSKLLHLCHLRPAELFHSVT